MEIKINGTVPQLLEYQLVIELPADLLRQIEAERLQLTENYGILQPPTGRPAVSLARFKASKMMERKIINKLQQLVIKEKAFMIEIKDFGSYPMHAVFIEINNQEKILALIKNLKQARQLMKAAGDEPYFLLDPQIVLAGRLANDKFIEIMKEYAHKKFAGNFLADSFLLLKKNEAEKKYEVVKRFEFEHEVVKKPQGVLF